MRYNISGTNEPPGVVSPPEFHSGASGDPMLIIVSFAAHFDPPVFFIYSALHAATTVNQGQITQNCRRYTSGKNGEG